MYMYHHHVSGIFQRQADAKTALKALQEKGLPLKRMQLFEREAALLKSSAQARSNLVLKNMLVTGTIGAVIGMVFGGLTQAVMMATNHVLLFANPWVTSMAMLGWGASVGGTVGAMLGAIKTDKNSYAEKEGWFSELIRHAIANGQVVLIVETISKHETALVGEVMQLSVNNYQDVKLV